MGVFPQVDPGKPRSVAVAAGTAVASATSVDCVAPFAIAWSPPFPFCSAQLNL